MFGGHTLYCDGVVFALVSNNALYLKADDANRGEFEARGLRAFCPFEDRPEAVMQYYEAPPEMFEDPDALTRWAGGAITAGRNKQRKKKPQSPR
jgi:DNA transformation protein